MFPKCFIDKKLGATEFFQQLQWSSELNAEELMGEMGDAFDRCKIVTNKLVGGFNPSENISQIGNLPQIGVKIKPIWNHHLVKCSQFWCV